MNCWTLSVVWLSALISSTGMVLAQQKPSPAASLIRIANRQLQIGLDSSDGTLRELVHVPDGDNRLAGDKERFSLWEIVAIVDGKSVAITPSRAGPPRTESFSDGKPGLRLTWDRVALFEGQRLRVTAEVRLEGQDSRWELAVTKPPELRLKEIRFPRVPCIKPREREVLAVPVMMGRTLDAPRKVLYEPGNRNPRFAWHYPFPLTMQCLAYYEPDGPGFFAACDDAQAYSKSFVLAGDRQKRVHFEVLHDPEAEATGTAEFRLPYAVVLGAFHGDWITAAQRYRELPAVHTLAKKGRLRRNLVPDWVKETGLWVWNRGRSEQVLLPAAALQKHVQLPVSVLWHWWHDCAYDAGFPEYLPPREGVTPFQTAMKAAHQQGLHALLYMNQRLWGMTTASWKRENAEPYAIKGRDGKLHPENYNRFMPAPCAVMCIGTEFWRKKFAGLATEAFYTLNPDGIYLDQTGVTAACYDPAHGHVVGPGRYWFEGFDDLAAMIRDRRTVRGQPALGGEFGVEPVAGDLDAALCLDVSGERFGTPKPWKTIPFFQAVYHASTITFGNYSGLVYPPYDERWPAEKAPPERLTLLDRKYSRQFYMEQARTFVWGIQPMIANFRPELLEQRREEIDYLTRLVRTRHRALKYLLYGTWLRPPALDVPRREIDVAKIGIYTHLTASKREYPVAVAGAWRAPDGDVAIALASIHDETLSLRLPIDFQAYGLGDHCSAYRIDESGRYRLGSLSRSNPLLEVELSSLALWVLELCRAEKP